MNLILYYAPGSSSFAPHMALNEIGCPFELRKLSLSQRETRSREYLALNPEGKVPTLVVDGEPLTEVAAISLYLAKKFPEAKLLPPGVEAEAKAISWMSFVASTLHPARRRGEDYAREVFKIADAKLGGKDWALGDYSIADIHLFRLFWRFKGSFNPARAEYPSLFAHHDRMMARPAVKKTCDDEARAGYDLPA